MTQVPTPSTQLSTDDWAPDYSTSTGSVNLGIKAIIGLAAASQIATILGDTANATTWSDAATNNVGPWINLSTDASAGNYLNVVQGATGTWSSLYNAYYEMVIGVSLVPDQIAADQATFYLNQLTTYGMPLQTDAGDLNKVAWLFYLPAWLNSYPIATELMSRNVAYINDTPSLVPYGDRYNTEHWHRGERDRSPSDCRRGLRNPRRGAIAFEWTGGLRAPDAAQRPGADDYCAGAGHGYGFAPAQTHAHHLHQRWRAEALRRRM